MPESPLHSVLLGKTLRYPVYQVMFSQLLKLYVHRADNSPALPETFKNYRPLGLPVYILEELLAKLTLDIVLLGLLCLDRHINKLMA